MNKLFILWIIFQLLIIGATSAMVNNQIVKKELGCKPKIVSEWVGLAFPLAAFVNNDNINYYCKFK